ncbi:TPA: hypothetical protein ACH3X1_009883 [Trebouxia sp. C0004]
MPNKAWLTISKVPGAPTETSAQRQQRRNAGSESRQSWATEGFCLGQLPQSLEPFAKRHELDVYGMRSSGGELEQLARLADSINRHELKLSTAACMLKQLFDMPVFCTEEKLPRPVPFGIYS